MSENVDSVKNTEVTILREAIVTCLNKICESLKCEEIITHLVSGHCLNIEQMEQLECERKNLGSTAQARKLMCWINNKDITRDDQFAVFIDVIQQHQPTVWYAIEEYINPTVSADDLQDIQKHLISIYKEQNVQCLEALPGEQFKLDVNDEKFLMPIVFNLRKLQIVEKDAVPFLSQVETPREIHYTSELYQNKDDIKHVVKKLLTGDDFHLAVCIAEAGMGKTVFMKQLLCILIDKLCKFKHPYKAVFWIPVREIDPSASIVDILCNLKYIKPEKKSIMRSILADTSLARSIFMVIDGADEKEISAESELFKYINGTKYGNVKGVISVRPDPTIFHKLKNFLPQYFLCLQGTTKTGILSYLKAVASFSNGPKEGDLEDVVKKCQEHMVDVQLLQVPLYLTLIGFIFNKHWLKYFSFDNLQVPTTMTKLFKLFFHILIRTWLRRLKRDTEADGFTFEKNPLELDSTVPRDIKLKLVQFAQLSYKGFLKQKYMFGENDLMKHLIDEQDVTDSGLFCVSKQSEKLYFYRHKLFNEYMSALYISYTEFEDAAFLGLQINATIKISLNEVLRTMNVSMVMRFLFGLNPSFGMEILTRLESTGVMCIDPISSNCLEHEAKLCMESENPDVFKFMTQILLRRNVEVKALRIEIAGQQAIDSSSVVMSLCDNFNKGERIHLLNKWFNLKITKIEKMMLISTGNMPANSELTIATLSKVMFALLSAFQFPQVKSLLVGDTEVDDINYVNWVFPQLKRLYVQNIKNKTETVWKEKTFFSAATLSDVTGIGAMTPGLIRSLVGQELSCLRLVNTNYEPNVLEQLSSLKPTCIKWNKVQELYIHNPVKNEDAMKAVDHMINILQTMPDLKKLTLCIPSVQSNLDADGSDQLLSFIKAKLPHLTALKLFVSSDMLRTSSMLTQLQKMKRIQTIGININSIELNISAFGVNVHGGEVTQLAKNLTSKACHHIKEVHINIPFDGKEILMYPLCKYLYEKLKNPDVEIFMYKSGNLLSQKYEHMGTEI